MTEQLEAPEETGRKRKAKRGQEPAAESRQKKPKAKETLDDNSVEAPARVGMRGQLIS